MTRINLVPVEELTDQHLFAEYRERTLYQLSVVILVAYCAAVQFSDYAARHSGRYKALKKGTVMYVNETKQLERQVFKLESIIVGCLNGHGIIVAGRNKDCIIKEYKGD